MQIEGYDGGAQGNVRAGLELGRVRHWSALSRRIEALPPWTRGGVDQATALGNGPALIRPEISQISGFSGALAGDDDDDFVFFGQARDGAFAGWRGPGEGASGIHRRPRLDAICTIALGTLEKLENCIVGRGNKRVRCSFLISNFT